MTLGADTLVHIAKSRMSFTADSRSQVEVHKPHVVLITFIQCLSHTDLYEHKPDGLIYEVIETVHGKLVEAAAPER